MSLHIPSRRAQWRRMVTQAIKEFQSQLPPGSTLKYAVDQFIINVDPLTLQTLKAFKQSPTGFPAISTLYRWLSVPEAPPSPDLHHERRMNVVVAIERRRLKEDISASAAIDQMYLSQDPILSEGFGRTVPPGTVRSWYYKYHGEITESVAQVPDLIHRINAAYLRTKDPDLLQLSIELEAH